MSEGTALLKAETLTLFVFRSIASMSGSLWFPGIKEYIFSHEEIEAFYRSKGIDTVFGLNPGNHFQDAVARSADGIAWILSK